MLHPLKYTSFAILCLVAYCALVHWCNWTGGMALVGCGDGELTVIDIRNGISLYSLKSHQGAVRCIEACQDRLLTSGDDGNTFLYMFGDIATEK